MTAPLICTGEVTMVDTATVTCAGQWQVYESDLLEFAHLLAFDLEMFGVLFGTCVVFFIIGHSTGRVAKLMNRV